MVDLRADFISENLDVFKLRELSHVTFKLFDVRFGGRQSELVLKLGLHLFHIQISLSMIIS